MDREYLFSEQTQIDGKLAAMVRPVAPDWPIRGLGHNLTQTAQVSQLPNRANDWFWD